MDPLVEKGIATDGNGPKIAWTLERPKDGSLGLAVMLHGFSSGQNNSTNKRLTPLMLDAGISVFKFDFRGCGESGGVLSDTSISNGLRDLKVAMENCFGDAGPTERLLGVGSSFGAAVLLASAKEMAFDRFALKSPMIDIQNAQLRSRGVKVMRNWEKKGTLNVGSVFKPKVLSFEYVSDARNYDFFKANWLIAQRFLIVHGDKDEVAPFSDSARFVEIEPSSRELVAIAGANHKYSDETDFDEMISTLHRFLIS